jgi:hypothetical protein
MSWRLTTLQKLPADFFPDFSESTDDSKPSNDHQVPTADAMKRFCFVDGADGK